jgi:crossover junction endodeoxyribonuclease RuvC
MGIWLGVMAALRMPYTPVRPVVWKKAFSLGKDKEASRLRAQQLFPSADLRRKRDHGRAEALLLAWYGRQARQERLP